ncbi:MAG: restriction endonuclease [Candidatus Nitrosocosmicus sp.]|nr:restriction endonuclease [Candidatus Nitrosocosmicus sp.]
MSKNINPKLDNVTDSLHLILNAIPSAIEEIISFEKVEHMELCEALKYWVEQLRLIFGYPITIELIHGNNEYGIDLYIDLGNKDKAKFAIQVKSYKDIEKSNFNDSVYSQIAKSKKHGLSKLIFAFAADLTKQNKISHILSEIHTYNVLEDIIIVLNSRELFTIFYVYKRKLRAVDYLNLNFHNILQLANSFTNLLSNEYRKAKVSISLEYLNKEKSKGLQISLKHRIDVYESNLLDRVGNIQDDDKIIIPQEKIEHLEIFDNEQKVFSYNQGDLTITKKPDIVLFTIQSLSEEGSILSKIENM